MLPDLRVVIATVAAAIGLLAVTFALAATFRVAQNRSSPLQIEIAQRSRVLFPASEEPVLLIADRLPEPAVIEPPPIETPAPEIRQAELPAIQSEDTATEVASPQLVAALAVPQAEAPAPAPLAAQEPAATPARAPAAEPPMGGPLPGEIAMLSPFPDKAAAERAARLAGAKLKAAKIAAAKKARAARIARERRAAARRAALARKITSDPFNAQAPQANTFGAPIAAPTSASPRPQGLTGTFTKPSGP